MGPPRTADEETEAHVGVAAVCAAPRAAEGERTKALVGAAADEAATGAAEEGEVGGLVDAAVRQSRHLEESRGTAPRDLKSREQGGRRGRSRGTRRGGRNTAPVTW